MYNEKIQPHLVILRVPTFGIMKFDCLNSLAGTLFN